MSFAPRLLFLLLISTAASAWAMPFTGVRNGEKFTYKVGFAIFSRAGEIVISGQDNGKDTIKVTAETNSRGFVRGLYTFDNKAEATIDKATSRLLSVHESGTDKDRTTNSDFVVDYPKRVATYTDKARPERSREIALPEGGDPLDLISALVQTRDWDLKPGEKRDVVVQFTRELYAITITAEGYEEIRTPLGKYKTLVLVPRMEKEPKGMFKRGGEIKVWIAQDGSRLPVKMQLKLNFGTAQLLLSAYEPPAK